MEKRIYQEIAMRFDAIENCRKAANHDWEQKHTQVIEDIIENYAPRGSGIDNGTQLDFSKSKPNRLVFTFSYHHYDGWTDHQCIVTPDLAAGFNIRITGPNRNDIKEYLYQEFELFLNYSRT